MATGTRTTYDNQGGRRRVIAEALKMIDWTEAPVLNLLGTDNAKKFGLDPFPNPGVAGKYEWQEDSMAPRSGTLDEALDASETGVDVQSGEGDYLKAGDVIKVDDELMYVSSVSDPTITAIRGFAGTTAATHSDDAPWELVTNATLEGAVSVTGYTVDPTQPYNYLQILQEAVQVTGSEMVSSDYGIPDVMARHIAKLIGGGNGMGSKGKAGKLAILLAKTFYHGQRAVGSATTARAMGGFEQFVTTNTTNVASAALTRKHIDDMIEDIFLAGGSPDCIVTNSYLRRKISSFFEGAIRTERSEARGGSYISMYETNGIELEVLTDRWCPQTSTVAKMYIMEKDKAGWVAYRPFAVEDRASTGDYEIKAVIGEYGFVLQNEQAHGYLYNVSSTK